jgi:radical SAM protein with 4Fe4S-binding SPASM domain
MAMRHNEHELAHLRGFCLDAGFDMATIRTLSIIDSHRDEHSPLVPESDLLRAYTYKDESRLHRRDFVCQHAFTFPTLMADGRLVACEQDYNCTQAYGTFSAETTFGELWRSSRASSIRRVIRTNPDQFSFCRNCPYADRQSSSCSIESLDVRPDVLGTAV